MEENGVNIPGATNPALTFNKVFFTDAANYVLYGTNSLGFTNTSAATLTVLPQPSYANQTNALALHFMRQQLSRHIRSRQRRFGAGWFTGFRGRQTRPGRQHQYQP